MTNGIDNIDRNGLVEVKGFKKANSHLLEKVLVGIGGIVLAVAILAHFNCPAKWFNKDAELDEQPAIEETVDAKTQGGTNKKVVYVPTTGGNGGKGDSGKPSDTNNQSTNDNGYITPADMEASWTTETLPANETITFGYFDKAEEYEEAGKLSASDKAYIQEYVDYYGISYEDARVSYLQFGPLTLSSGKDSQPADQLYEYRTVYLFDADDNASINALMSDLGYTRAQAEAEYVNNIAPAIGKTIATDVKVLRNK